MTTDWTDNDLQMLIDDFCNELFHRIRDYHMMEVINETRKSFLKSYGYKPEVKDDFKIS